MGKEQPLIFQFQVSTPGRIQLLMKLISASAFSKEDAHKTLAGGNLRPTSVIRGMVHERL